MKQFLEDFGKQTAPYFDVIEREFEIYITDPDDPSAKKKILTKEKRNLVYCTDIDAFEEFSRAKREIDPAKKLVRKWSIDGGGGSQKICLSLVEEKLQPNSPSNPKHQKKHHKGNVYLSTLPLLILTVLIDLLNELGNFKQNDF